MDAAAERKRLKVIRSYLRQNFPGSDLWDRQDHDRSAHTFSVPDGDHVLLLTVSFAFLRDFPITRMAKLLGDWRTADVLREAGAARRLVVTTTGLKSATRRA